MRKVGLIAIFLFPLWVSAAMSITTNEQVSHTLQPDILQGALSFEEQSRNATTIKEHLGAIVAQVKKFDAKGEFCQGGGYYISPRYEYKNQKQEFVGYSGTLSFACEFKTLEEYNALLGQIGKVTAFGVHKSEGALSWGVSQKAQKVIKQALRIELLRVAKTQSEAFSKELGMQCGVETVGFDGVSQPRAMMKTMMMADSAATQSPILRDEELVLEAVVRYGCLK